MQVEYLVLTECGRRFGWAAVDLNQLFHDMHERNYKVTYVKPMSEYEAEIHTKEEQERLNRELKEAIERELKESA